METGIFVVRTSPREGCEDQFNDWYDCHIKELIEKVGGVVSARRYRLISAEESSSELAPYLAVYYLEGESVADIHREIRALRASGGLTPTDTANLEHPDIKSEIFIPLNLDQPVA